jgi:hypothetical protein
MSGAWHGVGGGTSAALRWLAVLTVVVIAFTESFEVLPAALAAYASAYLLLRD